MKNQTEKFLNRSKTPWGMQAQMCQRLPHKDEYSMSSEGLPQDANLLISLRKRNAMFWFTEKHIQIPVEIRDKVSKTDNEKVNLYQSDRTVNEVWRESVEDEEEKLLMIQRIALHPTLSVELAHLSLLGM